jgi:hypothetical protein
MSRPRVKFRCLQCQQLLAAPQSRVGAVVACPKCKADVLVPPPAPDADAPRGELGPVDQVLAGLGERPADSAASEPGVSLDLLDIRPEDIRVEPGVRASLPARDTPEPKAEAEHGASPVADMLARVQPAPQGSGAPAEAEEPTPLTEIQLEGPRRAGRAPAQPVLRPHDLVIPRSVVTAWSLFVLLALALAFAAGLLAGHFVWKVHV